MRIRVLRSGLAVGLALALAACVPDSPPAPAPTVTPSTPAFASDEEALAAAEEVYRQYLAVSDLIGQEGGANPERLAPFVTEEQLAREFKSSAYDNGAHLVGSTFFSGLTLQQYDPASGELRAYTCVDVSQTDIVDPSGNSTLSADRPLKVALELLFQNLLLANQEPWSDSDIC